ncbi:solute carrier family 41 member 3 isoform 2 [Camelus ferus]|nr:solute carrier family 41 member 3 isoform 2 [Camelus ferus]
MWAPCRQLPGALLPTRPGPDCRLTGPGSWPRRPDTPPRRRCSSSFTEATEALPNAGAVTVPFVFAGLGLSGAGILLNYFQKRALVRTEDGTGTPRAQLSGPWGRGHGLVMVVTQLNLEFRFQGGKLRGFSCELTRSPHGVFPETFITITGQIVVPVLLSGLGMVTAGLVMNAVQVEEEEAPERTLAEVRDLADPWLQVPYIHPGLLRSPVLETPCPRPAVALDWPVFVEVKDLLTLVPPLVGLKGNLEMTLASRLSTALRSSVFGWACSVVSDRQRPEGDLPFAVLLVPTDLANMGHLDEPQEQHRVISSNLALIQVQATVVGLLAAGAALLLGAVSRQELDLTTAEVLCASSVLAAFLAAFALGVLMVCIVIGARKLGVNPDNIATPIAASLGDLITLSLLAFVSSFFYKHRGVGGNLVAIQTSRVSTYLHVWSMPGVLPLWMKKLWPDPCSTFCTSEVNSTSARVLLLLAAPGHLLFFYIVCLVEGPTVPNDKTFVVLYLLAGLVQVTILLYLAEVAVRLTWHQALDPDSHCIPYLTGLGDLLGTGLLALCFLSHGLLMGGISGPVPGPS